MGVRFNREYEEILKDFSTALASLEDSAEFVEMDVNDWHKLSEKERLAIAQTVADDLFFALGEDPILEFGNTKVIYDPAFHDLTIVQSSGENQKIKLI
jgi:hypothetical protein